MESLDKSGYRCDPDNSQESEAVHYNFVNAKLKCNLPWAPRFKMQNQEDCFSAEQMKAYFELARNIDQFLTGMKNCKIVSWHGKSLFKEIEPNRSSASLWIGLWAGHNTHVII